MISRELVRPGKPWDEDVREVHRLLEWLVGSGRILSLAEAVDMVETPRKWDPERREMLADEDMGRLHDEQVEDLQRRASL